MDETSKSIFNFQDPSFTSANQRATGFSFPPNDTDPFFHRKTSIDFCDTAFLPDYLNNEDQLSYGNFNFDELPLKEEKRAYINSFLPQEIIGVYNNQQSEHAEDQLQNFPSQEDLFNDQNFPSNPLNFNELDENLPDLLPKDDDFEVPLLFFLKVKSYYI